MPTHPIQPPYAGSDRIFRFPTTLFTGVAVAAVVLASLPASGQTYVDPSDALAIWDFNNTAIPTQSADLMQATPMVFQASAAFSADAGGRTGLAGDRALNLGTAAGNYARVSDAGFLGLLNQSNLQGDQLTVVFWQKWSVAVANSSSIWFVSTSAGGTNRGFQGHVPWGDGTIYFDTSGCCTGTTQRINAAATSVFPGFNWQQWHHFALVKNGGAKQVWVDGQLLVSQASGASALLGDWTEMLVGTQYGALSGSVRGLIDDFGVFGTALTQSQIAELAAGASPASLVVPPDQRPPQFPSLSPPDGTTFHPAASGLAFTVTTVSPNTLPTANLRFFLNGIDQTSSLSFTGGGASLTATYTGSLQTGRFYSVRAEATDSGNRTSTANWSFDTADPAVTPTHVALDLAKIAMPAQSAALGSATADLAIDNSVTTFSSTTDAAGSFWAMELPRTVAASRVYVTAPPGAQYDGVLDGSVVRLYNLDDQVVFESVIDRVAPGGVWAAFLPAGTEVRGARIFLPEGQTNGAGDHRIAVADFKLIGDPSPAYGPLDLASIGTVSQSTTNGTNTAALAIDGNASTVSETTNVTDSHWLVKLDRARPVSRLELVNRSDGYASRISGLTVRFYDDAMATLATTTTTNPGSGATWAYNLPAGTPAVRYVRIGLENGATNGQGDRVVSIAGLSLFHGTNYALNTPSYMVRLVDTLPSPALANDGNHATSTETTTQTTDGYWETDLGSERSLYAVRAVAMDSSTDQARLAHATVRLFDANHESVYSEHLSGTSANFDVALPGPVRARYVRVGLENKERTNPNYEWYLRLREVQAFGRPVGETGLTNFAASQSSITSGQSVTLSWHAEDLRGVSVFPGTGSVGALVDASGNGTLVVTPAVTTEYTLLGTDHTGTVARHLTVEVDGQPLPPRISEFCADNRLSLRDGYGDATDWVELRNPNNSALDIGGYGLSDNPATPMKWLIPAGTIIAPHGTLLVMASGRTDGTDPAGHPHAAFSLNAAGESVVLTLPDGVTRADAILAYPPQREDLAYGISADGIAGYLTPTPGAFNPSETLTGWLLAPTFSHQRGFYDAPFPLVLTNPNPGSDLLYSTDGGEPDQIYSGPIAVNGSVCVRAAVRRDGYHSPPIDTHTYVFRDSVMASPLMNTTYTQGALSSRLRNSLTQLPTICLSVPMLPDDYNERTASIEVILPDGSTPVQVNAGLVRTGGSWTDFPKKSYRVSFRAQYGARNLDVPLFRGFDRGIPAKDSIDTLDLTAGNHDMVDRGFYMANRFVEDTMLEMGSLNPHGRFVHVYVNGIYWGQYNAHERLEDSFLASYLGGSNSDYVNVRGNDNSGDNFVLGAPEPPNREPWETARANRSSYLAVKDRVDLVHLIDFMLVWYYGNCESEFRCAGPILPGSGFKFWSADADGFLRTSALTLDRTANTGPGGIFGALVAEGHPDFKTLLADRIYRHFYNSGPLTPERNLARLNTRMDEVRDSLIAECARWNFRTPDNWSSAAETIRTGLFPQRTANLLAMLKTRGYYPSIEPPVLSKYGGSVPEGYVLTFGGSAGTICYTLDGSDPRAPGGGVKPGASSASVTQQTAVARGTPWKYWDQGSLPAANWNSAAYQDSGWSSGAAPLGYGGYQTTTIGYGGNPNNKYITSYFRKTFTVANPATVSGLTLSLVRDDGAVVYLNGTEIARSNMPATGTIGYSTPATAAVSGDAGKLTVYTFSVPPGLLVAGDNLLAVEIHQSGASSSDLLFDLGLDAAFSPSISLTGNTNLKARLLSGGTWSALADATFHVAHPLIAAGPYVFNRWDASSAAATYPAAMRLFQTDLVDPGLSTATDAPWTLPYNLTSRSRINGLDDNGIGFINTGSVQTQTGAGFAGAAVVALDTIGAQDIRVTWTGGTVVPNDRDYGIRLQYRVGGSGDFTDVPGPGGAPVEYLRNPVAGHSQIIGPVTLPAAAENQSLVEIRWKYYFRSGSSGARPQLRLDDIQVTAGPVTAESLAIVGSPATAQAGRVCGPVTVEVRGRNGALAADFSGTVTISIPGQPGMLGGTLTRQCAFGGAVFDDLVFAQPGVYSISASAAGLTGDTTASSVRVAGLTELVMPEFIQGSVPTNNDRVPFACLVRLEGLLPSSTYRYAPQFVDGDDGPDTEGAGNPWLAGNPYVRCTASPRFVAGDLGTRHGEFTTDATGALTGWFMLEPTANPRFTPGATGWIRLLLNDGSGGDATAHVLTAASQVGVLGFGNGADQGSAVFGESAAAPRNVMVFYGGDPSSTRPLAATPVEATGIGAETGIALFYQNEVAGHAGRWGTILPNNLTAGVRAIREYDLASGAVVASWMVDGDHAPTVSLAGGLDATGISVPSASSTPFRKWLASRFGLSVLADPARGGVLGDPDDDGVPNLCEFAFGMDPSVASRDGLPTLRNTPDGGIEFTYRRLAGGHGLVYQTERSAGLAGWTEAEGIWEGPERIVMSGDMKTETVTRRLAIPSGETSGFFRVRVSESD